MKRLKTFGIFPKAYGKNRAERMVIRQLLKDLKESGVKMQPYYSEQEAQRVLALLKPEWQAQLEVNEYCCL